MSSIPTTRASVVAILMRRTQHGVVSARICANCSATGANARCGQCRQVYYCHQQCQMSAWTQGHRDVCRRETQADLPQTVERLVDPAPLTRTAKREKKKSTRKKKKNKRSVDEALKDENRREVSWGLVYVREHVRCVGGSLGVPLEGTWALGLGFDIHQTYSPGSIDVFEARRQEELRQRMLKISCSSKVHEINVYETRPFDYKSDKINVLFTRQTERERKHTFLHERLSLERTHAMTVRALRERPELEDLRHSREFDVGCDCGNAFLELGKLSVKKLRKLDSRVSPPALGKKEPSSAHGMTKPELVARLTQVARSFEPCGQRHVETCECARNGIPCHEQVCGAACRALSSGEMSPCVNPVPMSRYDALDVQQYRQLRLQKNPAI